MKILRFKLNSLKRYFSLPAFLLGVLLSSMVFIFATTILISEKHVMDNMNKEKVAKLLIKPVNASEIYPEFVCGCCGKPLNPDSICCGDMRQKINYINSQVEAGFSHEDIIFRTAKKYGMESLAKAETKEEIKEMLIAQAPADAPKIVFEQDSQDLGQVSQAEGVASTTFNFSNEGKSELTINKLTTSCGCTSASIIYKGKEGPTFTMPGHGKINPTNWYISIAPGDKAQLKVYYDPNAHGKQEKDILSITRTISVFSNDPVEFEVKVRIELEQIP